MTVYTAWHDIHKITENKGIMINIVDTEDIPHKHTFTNEVKARQGHIEVKLINTSLIAADWFTGVCFRHPSLNPINDSQIKDYPAATCFN